MRGFFNLNSYKFLSFITALVSFALCSFTFAAPPQIDPEGEFELPTDCMYGDFQVNFEVIDTDGDYVFVNSNLGEVINTQFYVDIDGVGHWEGYFFFNDTLICNERFFTDLIISADDHMGGVDSLSIGPVYVLGRIDMSMDEKFTLPEDTVIMPVYMESYDCFKMGGFEITVQYDHTVFDVVNVELGEMLIGYESYFLWYNDTFGDGTDDFIFIARPESTLTGISSEDPILNIEFAVLEGAEYIPDSAYQICFYEFPPYNNSNAITDELGLTVWFPNGCANNNLQMKTECGSITILVPHDLTGDVNLNGYPYEVGDAVLAHNAVRDMMTYPLILRQWYLSDVDSDENLLTIRDLFSFIEALNGVGDPADPLPFPYNYSPENDTLIIESADLNPGQHFSLPLYMINHDTLFDFQVNLDIDTSKLTIDSLVFTGEIPMTYTNPPELYHILSYDFDAAFDFAYYQHNIPPGNYHICDIYGSIKSDISTPNFTSIVMDAESNYGVFTGCTCAEFFEPVIINSAIYIGSGGYQYLPGDATMYHGIWPPQTVGSDVTYLVNYFRGIENARPCLLDGLYAAADVNGDCQVIGSDVTYLVSYFRAIGQLRFCEDIPPIWLSPDDIPAEMPDGWPNCEE